MESVVMRAMDALESERDAIADLMEYLDREAYIRAVKALASAPRVMTCASGSSGIAAKKFAHSLCCVEKGAMFMPPCEAVHGGLGGLKSEDAMVMVSRGGKTAELLPIIEVCNKKGSTLIGVTENTDSPLARSSQIVLPLKIRSEADKYDMMATSSFVATIALFDALLVGVMEATGYRKEQFALIHPGGAVGERLNGT